MPEINWQCVMMLIFKKQYRFLCCHFVFSKCRFVYMVDNAKIEDNWQQIWDITDLNISSLA